MGTLLRLGDLTSTTALGGVCGRALGGWRGVAKTKPLLDYFDKDEKSWPKQSLILLDESVYEMMSNLQEAKARGGTMIVVSDAEEEAFREVLNLKQDALITVPTTHPLLTPTLMVIPLQLLAYHIAVLRGCDVDQPRNLAKSVTVE